MPPAVVTEPRSFRRDLEGLRAVAVGLVLLFHARLLGFTGGYVGVDVFFVLSGFLITGLLIREFSEAGRISLWHFYARRARRLLPAAAVALAVTAIASALLLPPLRFADVGADIVAASLYASNIRFAAQAIDYLGSELAPSPVLHFWSLGVEEQFYLFWPALLTIVAGGAFAARRREAGLRRVGITLAVVLIVSLTASIWLTAVQQPLAFFSLPTRAWELALGGLLALPLARTLVPERLGPILAWVGVGLVVASGVVITPSTLFPGIAALLPTVGSALVIAGGLPSGGGAGPGSLLALAPIRYLGRISYSLYLWHWPILVLPEAAFGTLPAPVRVVLAGLAVVVAAASHRWVEEPIRHGRAASVRPGRVLAFAGAASLTVAMSGVALAALTPLTLRPAGPVVGGPIDEVPLPTTVARSSTTPTPTLATTRPGPVPADLVPSLVDARDDLPAIYTNGCHVGVPERYPATPCVFGDPDGDETIVLFGDSHAAQWFPTLERIAKERHWRLLSMTKSGCSSVDVPVWNQLLDRPYEECTAWREAAVEAIGRADPALVVISNAHRYSLALDGELAWSTDHEDVWSAGLSRTIDRLSTKAHAIVLIGDTPRMADDPPVCLSKRLDDASACATSSTSAVPRFRLTEDLRIAAGTGVTFVDPTPWLCPTEPCPVVIGRFLVYRDRHHMTATYARALGARFLPLLPPVGP